MITYSGREPTPKWVKPVSVGVVSAIIVAIMFASYVKWTNFMESCMEDRPRYECEVLWAQANPPTPTVNVYSKD